MKLQNLTQNKSLAGHIERMAIIGIIFLFTFPAYYVDYDIGLDSSYVWGLNWLFANDYETLKQLIYPFGPLAFLKIPTVISNNLLISILFCSTLKLGFIWLLFKLSDIMGNTDKLATILIAFIVSFFTGVDFHLIGSCLILNLIYYKKKNSIPFIVSVLLAFIGLFIKVSIGISALSIVAVSVLIGLLYSKNWILLIKQIGIIAFIGFISGILVFGNLIIYFQFLIGAYKLSGGYGESLSLHPANNWILLVPFLVLMVVFPFICKEKDVRIAYLLSAFPLFAAWKHTFIREDIFHYTILVTFLFVFWGIIIIVSSKKTLTLLVAAVTILLLYGNMWRIETPYYSGIEREVVGINNFRNVLKHKNFKKNILTMSENNISRNRLSPEIRAIIGNASVDAYPWEFSYIAANQFNWKPRKTFGISLFPLSGKNTENADYTLNASSPDFVIFHLLNDHLGAKFGSLDQRYILNDEPSVIYNLLNNYRLLEKTDEFLLFKRDTAPRFEKTDLGEEQHYQFDEWIDVPYKEEGITRLKVFSSNTFLGKLNKFFYKEIEYFIDYQFEDGTILTYRYVPATAAEGLWCNPFLRQPNTDEKEGRITKVRLRNTNPICVKKTLKVQFQYIKPQSERH